MRAGREGALPVFLRCGKPLSKGLVSHSTLQKIRLTIILAVIILGALLVYSIFHGSGSPYD